ncbi:hypothetical protein [Lawsonella clevelandensis]|uniref:hypothetical protein n=1 Tax=Lawsonella clevelandensis TaxID=1528099 RepID=UPI0026C94AF0|nr:hypothetical protein [Lawsonella clevelandensis]
MVYSEFGGDHYNAQPSTPFTPSIPPKRITTTELPIVDPDPGERPFLLSDDATTPLLRSLLKAPSHLPIRSRRHHHRPLVIPT